MLFMINFNKCAQIYLIIIHNTSERQEDPDLYNYSDTCFFVNMLFTVVSKYRSLYGNMVSNVYHTMIATTIRKRHNYMIFFFF